MGNSGRVCVDFDVIAEGLFCSLDGGGRSGGSDGKSLTVGLEEITAPQGATAIHVGGDLSLETIVVQAGCGRHTAKKSFLSPQNGVSCSGVLGMRNSMLIAYTSGEVLSNFSAAIFADSINFNNVMVQAFSGDIALLMREPDEGVMFALQGQDWYGSLNYDGSDLKECTGDDLYTYRHLQILPKGTAPVR